MTDVASLGIVVKTQGAKEAARDLARLEKDADKAERRAVSLGKAWGIALGAGAAAVIVGGVKAIIRNTIEAEKVQARLENRVRALGASSVASVKQVESLADALQGVSTFDDEAIKSAATSLLAFNNIKPQNFERALRAATDLAADTGQELEATAERIGKALNNPVTAARALRDIGIELSASQKNVLKDLLATGREAEAQALVLAELEKRYGGAAAAARNTLGGSLTALKVAFGNLLEGNGGINETTRGINQFTDTLNSPDVRRGAEAIVSGVLRIGGALATLVGQLANATSALNEFFAANEKKGLNSLVNKRNDLEGQLFAAQRRSGQGLSDANDPIAKLLGKASGRDGKVKAIKAEIAEIDREIAARERAANSAKKAALVESGVNAGFANFSNNKPGSAPGIAPAKAGRSGGGSRSLRDFPNFAATAAADAAELAEAEDRATEAFRDMQAVLEGPLAVAERDHVKRVDELNALAKASPEAMAGLSDALAKEAQLHEKNTAALKKRLDPLAEVLGFQRQELDMIGLSNAERQVMNTLLDEEIDLRGAVAQAALAQARANDVEAEARHRQIDMMDDFRRSASDALFDVAIGAKSAKDAVKDFFDSLAQQLLRAASDNLVANLFGQTGSSGSGSSGNLIASLFSAFLGGGRALGGPVSAGKLYEVNERGAPELFEANGRQYLMPSSDGRVTPLRGNGSAGNTVIVNYTLEGRVSREVESQVAQRTLSAANRSLARNR
jgi:hypothetical protein